MAKRKSGEPQRFEDALCELEAIARELEEGTLGLDESLRRFEQGVGLLRHCYGILDSAERKIALLTGFDGEGNPVLEPFDATATAEQGTAGRRKARSASPVETDSDGEGDSPPAGRGLF
ncbi:MAG TPA: exodeoxyribonuclease VII small subunit [Planctomycetaceae bacterium]